MRGDRVRGTQARTVGDVARLTGVTVRTLHHYDRIGLVTASERSAAGYRLYTREDLERLQLVLFYRALDLPLERIRTLLDAPDFDRLLALQAQREQLQAAVLRTQRLVAALDSAITATEKGTDMSEEAMFAVFGEEQRALQAEAQERWGETEAWAQSQARTRHYTQADWEAVRDESDGIMQGIVAAYRSGAAPESAVAMDAVEAHRLQINERFYTCDHAMQVCLGEMYLADERFTATYEAQAEGLTAWVVAAINANARRAGVDA